MSSAKCERPIYTPALTRCNTKKGTGAGFRRDEKTLPGSPSPNHHNCSTATACSVHTQLCNCKTVQLQNCTTLQLRQKSSGLPRGLCKHQCKSHLHSARSGSAMPERCAPEALGGVVDPCQVQLGHRLKQHRKVSRLMPLDALRPCSSPGRVYPQARTGTSSQCARFRTLPAWACTGDSDLPSSRRPVALQ